MTLNDIRNGQRVRINRPIEIFPIGIFQPGLIGTIEDVDLTNHDVIAMVRLDERVAELDNWENCLQLQLDDSQGADCTIDAFDVQS